MVSTNTVILESKFNKSVNNSILNNSLIYIYLCIFSIHIVSFYINSSIYNFYFGATLTPLTNTGIIPPVPIANGRCPNTNNWVRIDPL